MPLILFWRQRIGQTPSLFLGPKVDIGGDPFPVPSLLNGVVMTPTGDDAHGEQKELLSPAINMAAGELKQRPELILDLLIGITMHGWIPVF